MSSDPRTDPSDDPLVPLFDGVARRPRPSEPARERALAAVEAEWEALQARRRKRRRLATMAMAASVLIGVLGVVLLRQPAPPPPLTLELVQGHVRSDAIDYRADGDSLAVQLGEGVAVRALGPSRWRGGHGTDVRVGTGTAFAWRTPNVLTLHSGQVYLATEGGTFAVVTAHGVVTDVGTRFLVATDDDALEVAVREGQVELATPFATHRTPPVRPGYAQVLVAAADRIVGRTEAASHERWNWIHATAKGYTTKSPVAMLREIARDLGKELRFAPGVEAALEAEELDGNFEGLAPWSALHRVVVVTATEWQEENNVITIAFRD